jgi:hypothetical protein
VDIVDPQLKLQPREQKAGDEDRARHDAKHQRILAGETLGDRRGHPIERRVDLLGRDESDGACGDGVVVFRVELHPVASGSVGSRSPSSSVSSPRVGRRTARPLPLGLLVQACTLMMSAAVHPEQTQLGRGVVMIGERLEDLERRRAIVADQQHIATGARRRGRARPGHPGRCRRAHAEVVAEDDALETEPTAQDVAQPDRRESGRAGVDLRIQDVGRHDPFQACAIRRSKGMRSSIRRSA